MNKNLRKLLFYFFIIIFIFAGIYIILAVQGLIINKDLTLTKTGGLYLNYTPQEAEVKINGVPQKNKSLINDFLNSGIFVDNLAPGVYNVEIEYPAYTSWKKNLVVQPGIVKSKTSIHLWPKKWNTKKLTTTTTLDFWLTNAGLVIKTPEGLYYNNKKIKGEEVVLSNEKRNEIVAKNGKNYYLIDLNNTSSSKIITIGDILVKDFIFHPFDQNALLGISKKAIYYFNFNDLKPKLLFSFPENATFYQNGNEIFIDEKNGKILTADLFLKTQVELSINATSPLTSFLISRIKTTPDGNNILLLTANGELYNFDRSTQTSTMIFKAKNIKDFVPSPDNNRLAILLENENNITILALKDFKIDEVIKKGDIWKINTKKTPDNFLWLDSFKNYGIFITERNVIITDLDKETPSNQNVILENIDKIKMYDGEFYFTQNGNLYSLPLESEL